MLDFRLLTFLAVCQCMNYTQAARMLNITQSAVSQHMKYLETQYDTKLIHFEGKKMSLTPAGKELLAFVRSMQHDIQHFQMRLKESTQVRHLHFGTTLTIGEYIMPGPLAYIIQHMPQLRVHMAVNNTQTLLSMLHEGAIDFAIIEGVFAQQQYDAMLFQKERFVPVCGANYVFKQPVRTMMDLLGEPILTREEGSGTREVLKEALWAQNIALEDLPRVSTMGNLNTIKELVRRNVGIAFLYESVVKQEMERGEIQEIQLEDFSLYHNFTFICQQGSFFKGEYAALFDVFQQYK